MRRKIMSAAVALLSALPAVGQVTWTPVGATTDIRNPNAGMVGIGVNPWGGKLHVYSTTQTTIRGDTTFAGASGVYGTNSAATGSGVVGVSTGATGVGVQGIANDTTGYNVGVYGATHSYNGTAVHAQFFHATGTGEALVAASNSPNAFAVYSVGGKNYFDGDTGFGTTSPSAQLHTTGSVRLQGVATAKTGTAMVAADSNGNLTKQLIPFGNGVAEFGSVGLTAWSVPAGVTRVRVKMWGGGAQGDSTIAGGSGAYVETVLDVSAISSLNITVGGGGSSTLTAGGNTIIANGGTTLVQAGGGGAVGGISSGGTTSNPVGATGIFATGTVGGVRPGSSYSFPPYLGRQVRLSSGSTVVGFLSVGSELMQGAVVLEW